MSIQIINIIIIICTLLAILISILMISIMLFHQSSQTTRISHLICINMYISFSLVYSIPITLTTICYIYIHKRSISAKTRVTR